MLLTPAFLPMPSPAVTYAGRLPVLGRAGTRRVSPDPDTPDTLPARPAVGAALVVDLDQAVDPGQETPRSSVLARHLLRRAGTVDLLQTPAPAPRRPDQVIGFTPVPNGEAAARIARDAGAPLVLVVQELSATPGPAEPAGLLLRAAARVAIPSETFREAVLDHGVPARRICLLPDWAHVVPPWLDRLEARRALGWPERAFIAVHPGTGPHHDVTTVVEAARLAGPDVTVALVADGSRPGPLRDLAAGVANVLLGGPPAADQHPLALVAADVVILSEPRGAGLVLPGELGSALASARPVIACAPPGGVLRAELTQAGGAGVVVPAGGARPLARALLGLRKDPARRVAMGLAGLAHAESHLSLRRTLDRFDDIVDAALAD